MRQIRPLEEQLLNQALKNLKAELNSMAANDKAFLGHYRSARLHAFEIEFLAKFLRKSNSANREYFESLNALAKLLEDRLGEFNEVDELIAYVEGKNLVLADGQPIEDHLIELRKEALSDLQSWLSRNEGGIEKMQSWLDRMEWLTDQELRTYAIKKMSKTLIELQDNVDQGCFDAKKKSGYQMTEVEPRVHEARREIRKIAMYATYLKGVFALTDRPCLKSEDYKKAVSHFLPLARGPVGQSDFSQLPPKSLPNALKISRPFFVGITKYVSELGSAKDWAQNLNRLLETGLKGEISFDQLDLSLKNIHGHPVPFNILVKDNLEEIRKTQIFRLMAEELEAQR